MQPTTLAAFLVAILFSLVFILATVFSDPMVQLTGQRVDFVAVSLLFGTINTLPLLFLVFKQDKTYKLDLTKFVEKMTIAVYDAADQAGKPVLKRKKRLQANISLHKLLGQSYTINPNVPMLKFASAIQVR